MRRIVVAEGRNDAIVLRTLLRQADVPSVDVVVGGGKSAALSLGASHALRPGSRVAIVVDADTTDRRGLDEQQVIFDDLYRRTAGDDACRLFLATPTLEGDLFPTVDDLEAAFGLKLTARQRAAYVEDWNLVLKSALTVPEVGEPTFIRTGGGGAPRPSAALERPLMRDLLGFLLAP